MFIQIMIVAFGLFIILLSVYDLYLDNKLRKSFMELEKELGNLDAEE